MHFFGLVSTLLSTCVGLWSLLNGCPDIVAIFCCVFRTNFTQENMAGKLLVTCLRNYNRVPIRLSSHGHDGMPHWRHKIGTREIVGFGVNGEASYLDLFDFPFPAVRFREITPDLQVLVDKEKGDWKKLTLDEKKILYRTSFCQTFAELDAPTGEWKGIIGCTLIGVSIAVWMLIILKLYAYPPLPPSFSEEAQIAQFKRIRLLDMNPIWGINKRPDL